MDQSPLSGLLGCGLGLAMVFMVTVIGLAIAAFISYLLYDAERRLPEPFREMAPALVFLLLVPLFNLLWLFFVVVKVSQSYQRYFAARQQTGVGDCGFNLGLAWAITAIAVFVPVLGTLSALASLVLMILYLMKIGQLKAMVGGGPDAVLPTP